MSRHNLAHSLPPADRDELPSQALDPAGGPTAAPGPAVPAPGADLLLDGVERALGLCVLSLGELKAARAEGPHGRFVFVARKHAGLAGALVRALDQAGDRT